MTNTLQLKFPTNGKKSSIIVEAGHIYTNEHPTLEHHVGATWGNMLSSYLVLFGAETAKWLFIDNYNPQFEEKPQDLNIAEIGIKNKIDVLILRKGIDLDYIIEFQKNVKKENGTMYVLEGTDNYTVITQEKYAQKLHEKFESNTIKFHEDLAIIDFKSPEEIEKITGVVSYLTSLFAENGVNILEFLSCWRDTIFVIDKKDVNKAISFLNF